MTLRTMLPASAVTFLAAGALSGRLLEQGGAHVWLLRTLVVIAAAVVGRARPRRRRARPAARSPAGAGLGRGRGRRGGVRLARRGPGRATRSTSPTCPRAGRCPRADLGARTQPVAVRGDGVTPPGLVRAVAQRRDGDRAARDGRQPGERRPARPAAGRATATGCWRSTCAATARAAGARRACRGGSTTTSTRALDWLAARGAQPRSACSASRSAARSPCSSRRAAPTCGRWSPRGSMGSTARGRRGGRRRPALARPADRAVGSRTRCLAGGGPAPTASSSSGSPRARSC